MTWQGLLENVVADIAFVVLVAPLGATLVFVLTRWRSHARLLRFLGCDAERPSVVVYFSALVVRQGGASDFRGVPRSFEGSAVPESEYLLAKAIAEELEAPIANWPSRLLASMVAKVPGRRFRQWLGPRQVTVRYDLSPTATPTRLPQAVTICLGSHGYNYATDFYLSNLRPLLAFGPDPNPDIRQASGTPVSYDGDVGMLRRLRVGDGHVVHIAAGLGTNGTRGALQYLFTHWKELDRQHKQSDYALALGYRWLRDDPNLMHPPEKLLELAR